MTIFNSQVLMFTKKEFVKKSSYTLWYVKYFCYNYDFDFSGTFKD